MKTRINLLKLHSEYLEGHANYYFNAGQETIHMNSLLGKKISIEFLNEINCIKCGKKTNKSFHQGYCYSCFISAPETDPSVINPELDQAHLGISRDMEWAQSYSLVEHVVYLAISSGLKVGVTREQQRITRWIDQGASSAIVLAKTPYRQLAGKIELALKAHFKDKTNWRKMLSNEIDRNSNLIQAKSDAFSLLPEELKQYFDKNNNDILDIEYPVLEYPKKVSSLSLDKEALISGILTGIKGQYLFIDTNKVFNVRKHNGYKVDIQLGD